MIDIIDVIYTLCSCCARNKKTFFEAVMLSLGARTEAERTSTATMLLPR